MSDPTAPANGAKQQAARETIDILQEIAVILNTGLDRTSLSLCISLIENGVNPEALAGVIKDLRRKATTLEEEGEKKEEEEEVTA